MKEKGFTIVEVLIAVFLMALIFLGIFGAYRLIAKVIQRSEKKITAAAIANQRIEQIRNISYLKVGTKNAELPYAQGTLTQSTTTMRNGIIYDLETDVKLISDSADGLDETECDWDYKRVQVTSSWENGQVKLMTDIAPKDKAEEIAVCQEQPGGILSVSVFSARGDLINSPLIKVFDAASDSLVDSYQPSDGKYDFPLATSTYKVVVSKNDHSTSSTYGSDEIAQPEKNNPVILEGSITNLGFAIDRVSTLVVNTLSVWAVESWSDSFVDQSKISEISGLSVSNEQVELSTSSTSGYLKSVGVAPSTIKEWDKLSWSDSEPNNTDFDYQLYYATSTNWRLISDSVLVGNSNGFDVSPVDLSSLSVNDYPKLKIKGNASSSTTTSPTLEDWQLSWKTAGGMEIGDTFFHVRGEKTIGKDANDEPVYKYSATSTSNSNGSVELYPMEWDSYHFRSAELDLDLATTVPEQPVSLSPESTTTVNLFFEAQNSFLLTVKNKDNLNPVLGASTTLSKTGYSKTQHTDDKGQTHYIPLDQADYNLNISAAGYKSTSTTVTVSGDETKTVKLKQVE